MRSGTSELLVSTAHDDALLDHLPHVVFRTDSDGRWTYLNRAWSTLTGLDVESSIGRILLEVVHPDDKARLASLILSDVCRGFDRSRHETRMRVAGGGFHWVEIHSTLVRDRWGRPVSSIGTITDIEERRATEEMLADETRVLELIAVDRALPEVLGATAAMVARHTGRRTSITEFPVSPAIEVRRVEGVVVSAGPDGLVRRGAGALWGSPGGNVIAIRALGTRTSVGAMVVEGDDPLDRAEREVVDRGRDLAAVAIRRHHDELDMRRQALYDPLTALPNRALLGDRLRQVVGEARRNGKLAALLVLDLDGFKDVNDMLGHAMGDRVLQEVGRRLDASLRDADTVGRLGGDEFVVVLAEVESVEAAEQVAAKLEAALEPAFEFDGVGLRVRASAGIALFPEHGDDFDTLLRRADAAMYRMKPEGGGSAVFAADADEGRMARVAVAAQLGRAIETGELLLDYQPRVELRSGRVSGVEALVRWRHPVRGVIAPSEFIELAEGTGLIGRLTEWVLEQAITDAQRWWADDPELALAVNLSTTLLGDPDVERSIGETVSRWALAPGQLELEVSEGALLVDPAAAVATMRGLGQLGVSFSFDDFGSGYSSLSYLKWVPVRTLKVDPSFVGESVTDPRDAAIVAASVHLAHAVGITVVAEGVEDEATRRRIEELGCDHAMGHHIGRPMPPEAFSAWLTAARERAGGAGR